MKALPGLFLTGIGVLSAWAFHDRYWRWRDCFNELGRCYDPVSEAVYLEQAGIAWGSLAVACLAAGLILLLRRSGRLRSSVMILAALAAIVLSPLALLAASFWAASGEWELEAGGLRHWMMVKGSRLEQLGLVEKVGGPARYSVSLQEGTFPGWSIVQYDSGALPAVVVAIYAARCQRMGFKVIRSVVAPVAGADDEAKSASLTCEIEPYIDAEIHVERAAAPVVARVSVRVWGGR